MGTTFSKAKKINEQNIKKLLDIKSIINITNRNMSSFTNNMNLTQAMDIEFNNVKGKDIKILQNMVGVLNVQEAIQNADITGLAEDIKNSIDSQMERVLEDYKKDLAVLFPNSDNTTIRSNIMSEIRKVSETTVTKENIDESLNELNANQNIKLFVNGSEIDGLEVGQNLQITMLANKMVNNFSKNLSESKIAEDLQDRIDDKEQKEAELESPLKTFTGFITKYWMIIGIVIIALIIGIVIMYYFFIKSPVAKTLVETQGEMIKQISDPSKIMDVVKLASGTPPI